MDAKAVKELYQQVSGNLHNRRFIDAIENLRKLASASGKEFYSQQLDEAGLTYENILKHSFGEYKDPQRVSIYLYLKRSLLEMADELQETALTQLLAGNIYAIKKDIDRSKKSEHHEAMTFLDALTLDQQLSDILKNVSVESSAVHADESLTRIFNIIWLTDKYTDHESQLINRVCDAESLAWYYKSLVVSALTLSLLRYFDASKFMLLFRFIETREQYVWQRALVGIFINFIKYNDRFYLYPALEEKTLELAASPDMEKNIEAILIQFTKTRETESVSRQWQDEILPAMLKLRPRIEEKLDLENIFRDEFGEERNPDWETFFQDDPGLLDKLQKFTEMQMEGMDVFMSAFSQLKNYPFFRKLSNWFIPFYTANPTIKPFLMAEGSQVDMTPLVEKLDTTFFMCNSDKYSFCINLSLIPDQQKTMMLNMAQAEMDSFSEIEKADNLINDFARSRNIITQYFQDLYRFFKLHPWKAEFHDVFLQKPDLFNNEFIKNIIINPGTKRNIAEFYFNKQFYPYALPIFLELLKRNRENVELFEKIAFCYEKTGDFQNAIDFYKKAEIIDTERLWIINKIAFCSKFLNRWNEALFYYRLAEKLNPADLKVQANIGQCLIHLEQYEEALGYYFKVEVLAPENQRIRRPLAWCSFVLGKFDVAGDYYTRLLESDPGNSYDLLNLGHVLWCLKKETDAIAAYKRSIAGFKDFRKFETTFIEDKKHLMGHHIDEFDIDLMMEFLKSGR